MNYNVPIFTANEAWLNTISEILSHGSESSPRGLPIVEVINHTAVIDMKHPVVLNKARALSYKFMAAEAWWIQSGRRDVASISKYCKNIARFSDDGEVFFGAYGPKIMDQLDYVIRSLIRDRDSRQAVLTIWRDNPPLSKDIPCTVSMQWLIRDNLLVCISNMRSNDIWLGFPYDVFNFSMLSWHVLVELKRRSPEFSRVELGVLCANAGSRHFYVKDIEKTEDYTPADLTTNLGFEFSAGHELKPGESIRTQLAGVIGEYDIFTPYGFFDEFQRKLLNPTVD
jgi:thymidylate synthase